MSWRGAWILATLAPAAQALQEPEPERGPEAATPAEPAFDPLSLVTDVGPVAPEHWRVIGPRHGSSADTFSLKRPASGIHVEDTILQASSRTAFICYEHRGPFSDITFRNSIVRVEPGTLELDRSYWAFRGYDMVDVLFERVEITGFGKVTPRHDEGHAIYFNLRGSLTIADSCIHHNGGQGLQLVNRPNESDFPPGPAEGRIEVRNTRFLENGFNPDRGAFQVSIFGTGQEIHMQDVLIAAGLDDTEYPRGQTGGGLLIEAEAWSPGRRPVWWRTASVADDFEPPFTQERTELVRVHVHQRSPNRPIVQIKGARELVVRECTFGEGRIELDDPRKAGRDCGRIVWEGNRGPAEVWVRGQRMGRASDDFVIEEE